MGSLLIVNGSPRAPRSNSRQYAALLRDRWDGLVEEYAVTDNRHAEIGARLGEFDELALVFPLYADALPAALLRFLVALEGAHGGKRPRVHAIVNCGFLEPMQNHVAVEMLRLFCAQQGFEFGMALCIGAGEAILTTPFSFLVRRKIKAFARGMRAGRSARLEVTMPLSPAAFVGASRKYWLRYGTKNGLEPQQMDTDEIEGS